MNMIPNELLVKIIGFCEYNFIKMRRVSKRFNEIIKIYREHLAKTYMIRHWYGFEVDDFKFNTYILLQSEYTEYLSNPQYTVYQNQALVHASGYGHMEVVRFLLDNYCDPTAEDRKAIRVASHYGYTEIVKLLNDKQRSLKN